MSPPPPDTESLAAAIRRVLEAGPTAAPTAEPLTVGSVDVYASIIGDLVVHREFPQVPVPDASSVLHAVETLRQGYQMLVRTIGEQSTSAVIVKDLEPVLQRYTSFLDTRYLAQSSVVVDTEVAMFSLLPNATIAAFTIPAGSANILQVTANGVCISPADDFSIFNIGGGDAEFMLNESINAPLDIRVYYFKES